MSTLKTNNVQIGQSSTPTHNFVVSVPVVPDGTMKIARGNAGATTQDIISVDSAGDVTLGTNGKAVGTTGTQTLTNKTFTGYTETVYSLAGTEINASNGTIQYKTLAANTTFTEALADGQSVTLMVNPVTYTITWPTVTWVSATGNAAPTIKASTYNCIVMWQMQGTVYARYAGYV